MRGLNTDQYSFVAKGFHVSFPHLDLSCGLHTGPDGVLIFHNFNRNPEYTKNLRLIKVLVSSK